MKRRVCLDTGPLYALLDARDQAHQRALALFSDVTQQGWQLVCPVPAALELHRLLLSRKPAQPERAHQALAAVMERYPFTLPNEQDSQTAVATLRRYSDQKITFADALIASMAQRIKAFVMTFDQRHFSLLGVDIVSE